MLASKFCLFPILIQQSLQWNVKDITGIFVLTDPLTPETCRDGVEVSFGENSAFAKIFCEEGKTIPTLWRGHWNQQDQTSITYGKLGLNDTKISINVTSNNEILLGKARLTRATKTTNLDTLALLGFSAWTSDNKTLPLTKLVFTEGKVTEHRDTIASTYDWKIARFGPNLVLGGYFVNPANLTQITQMEIKRINDAKIGYNGQPFSLLSKLQINQ